MNYFEHNTITEGRARIRRESFILLHYRERIHARENIGALFASAATIRERRLEGARLHKRGCVNEMPFYLYSAKARKVSL